MFHDVLNPRGGMAGIGMGILNRPPEAASWTLDAASGKGVPVSATEWTAVRAAAGLSGTAQHLYLCQEASGNLTDTIGGVTLTAANSPEYNVALSGWTRTGCGETTVGGSVISFSSTSASLPDLSAVSGLWLLYISLTATPDATREVTVLANGASARYVMATTSPLYQGNVSADASSPYNGASNPGTAVRPLVIMSNRSLSQTTFYTDQEVITTTWSNPAGAGKLLGWGSIAAGASAPIVVAYATLFTGSDAELSTANVKTLLQTLGWTIPW